MPGQFSVEINIYGMESGGYVLEQWSLATSRGSQLERAGIADCLGDLALLIGDSEGGRQVFWELDRFRPKER